MASTSCAKQGPVPFKDPASSNVNTYPQPEARYEEIITDPKRFMSSLEKFHAAMGTKFMIPIIGGKDLELHRLFVEVTARGGIEKVIKERKWKEVTALFNFPSTATNASYVLRKYYGTLLTHFEQAYFFRARGWSPLPAGAMQNSAIVATSVHGPAWRSPEIQTPAISQSRINAAKSPKVPAIQPSAPPGAPVIGVIDGKFEGGYLVTVTIGSQKLKGVLYQTLENDVIQIPQQYNLIGKTIENPNALPVVQRRRRRRKSEIKKRDPAHPKPNRSGYNFFFAEQHARLKPLHPGKDREISRMIGELWNKLQDPERVVYQEKALKDKERYRIEMENYRERQRTGQLTAVPPQLRLPSPGEMLGVNAGPETEVGESRKAYYECSSGDSVSEEDKIEENDHMEVHFESSANAGATRAPHSVAMETETRQHAENNVGKTVGDGIDERMITE
ncbi:hypothetical protein ACFE04_013064 [Oxalis oulophora]